MNEALPKPINAARVVLKRNGPRQSYEFFLVIQQYDATSLTGIECDAHMAVRFTSVLGREVPVAHVVMDDALEDVVRQEAVVESVALDCERLTGLEQIDGVRFVDYRTSLWERPEGAGQKDRGIWN